MSFDPPDERLQQEAITDLMAAMEICLLRGIELRAGRYGEKALKRFMMEGHYSIGDGKVRRVRFGWPKLIEPKVATVPDIQTIDDPIPPDFPSEEAVAAFAKSVEDENILLTGIEPNGSS